MTTKEPTMKNNQFFSAKRLVYVLLLSSIVFLNSCNKEAVDLEEPLESQAKTSLDLKLNLRDKPLNQLSELEKIELFKSFMLRAKEEWVDPAPLPDDEFYINDFTFEPFNMIEPSECGSTDYSPLLGQELELINDDFMRVTPEDQSGIETFGSFIEIFLNFPIFNRTLAFNGINGDYFGADGEYTNYVNNRVRSLKKFWDMENEDIAVYG